MVPADVSDCAGSGCVGLATVQHELDLLAQLTSLLRPGGWLSLVQAVQPDLSPDTVASSLVLAGRTDHPVLSLHHRLLRFDPGDRPRPGDGGRAGGGGFPLRHAARHHTVPGHRSQAAARGRGQKTSLLRQAGSRTCSVPGGNKVINIKCQ